MDKLTPGEEIQYKELKAEIRAVVVEIPRHRVEWLEGLYFVKYVGEDHRGKPPRRGSMEYRDD